MSGVGRQRVRQALEGKERGFRHLHQRKNRPAAQGAPYAKRCQNAQQNPFFAFEMYLKQKIENKRHPRAQRKNGPQRLARRESPEQGQAHAKSQQQGGKIAHQHRFPILFRQA